MPPRESKASTAGSPVRDTKPVESASQTPLKTRIGAGRVEFSDEGCRHLGIEDRRDDAAEQRAGKDRDERRKAQDRKGEDHDERKEGPERNIEMLRQVFHRMAGFAGNRMTEPREQQGGQDDGGNESPERLPDQMGLKATPHLVEILSK